MKSLLAKWLRNEVSLPIGKNNTHVVVRLIDYDEIKNNSFILSNQYKLRARETKIPDIVMFVNGIPLVVGEAKRLFGQQYLGLMGRMILMWYMRMQFLNYLYQIYFRLLLKARKYLLAQNAFGILNFVAFRGCKR